MRAAFQINTVYQLFITINMKLHNIPDGPTDIIVSDHTPALKTFVENLKKCGLFEKVFYVRSLEFNSFFWGLPNEAKPDAFRRCHESLKRVSSEPHIDYGIYDRLYTANLDAYTKFIHKEYPKMEICQIEDGAAICAVDWQTITKRWNYIEDFNKIYCDVKELYLYSPDLMGFQYPAPMIKLPGIERAPEVVQLFNMVFHYQPIEFPRFVFIEQSYQADKIKNNDLAFLQSAFDIVGYENLYIKPHPRNTIHRPFSYGLSKKMDDSIPFELMVLNNQYSSRGDLVYMTVDSGALISARMIFEDNRKMIFLYKAISGPTRAHGGKEFSEYMDRFIEKYADENLFAPGSLEEYRCILTHLL